MSTTHSVSDKTSSVPAARPSSGTNPYPGKPGFEPQGRVAVGGVIPRSESIEYNTGRRTVRLAVRNTGDRPVQIGSHFHFFEVNRYLEFDREAAFGCHLNIPATTAIRFEPGDMKEVELVPYAGKRRVIGFNNLAMGYTGEEDAPTYYPVHAAAVRRARHAGFKSIPKSEAEAALAKIMQNRAKTAGQNDNDKK